MVRREDARLVAGAGAFTDDHRVAGGLFAAFVRAPGTGALRQVTADAARQMPGVVAVFAADDLAPAGPAAVNRLLPLECLPAFQPLGTGHVIAGQGVALVVATAQALADDAADAVVLEIDDETPAPRNAFAARWQQGVLPVTERAVSLTISTAELAPMALEPRAVFARSDADGVTVWLSTQTPYRARDDFAALLGWPKARVRVIAPDVGGAFGGKASIAPEDAAIVLAATHLGRPVSWRASRSEEFLAATRGRGAALAGRLLLDADGVPAGLAAEGTFPVGHWWPYSVAAPARNFGRILPGVYRVPSYEVAVKGVMQARPALNIYRGAGRPEATLLMERLIDRAAAETGTDPLAYRLAHLLTPREMVPREGRRYDSADLPMLLKSAARAAGYARLRRAQVRRRAKGEVVGIGLATYIEPCGQGHEWARIGITAEGHLIASTGASAQGQGRETAMAQIVAEVLSLPVEAVTVREGDTGEGGAGIGALASRSTAIGGSAMLLAARALKRRLNGQSPEAFARQAGTRLDRHGFVLSVEKTYTAPAEAWASGAVVAAVAICRETGRLSIEKLVWADDAGVVVNPLLVEGQLMGGMAQGIGEALMERLVTDEDGQLMTGSLMDYAVPRASDIPPVTLLKRSRRSRMNPLGAKGVGEAGTIGIPAAIVNAACDALAPFGSTHLDMPLTSEKLWRALNRKQP